MSAKRPRRDRTVAEEPAAGASAIAPVEQSVASTGDAGSPPSSSTLDSLWPLIEKVIAPTTLLVALAYHFGQRYTTARSVYFGIHPSLLDFSTEDFVAQSADALLIPLGALVLAGLACVEIYRLSGRAVDRGPASLRWHRPALWSLRVAGSVTLIVGCYAALYGLPSWPSKRVVALLLVAGIVLLASSRRRPAVTGLRVAGAVALALGICAAVFGLPDWPSYLVPPLLPAAGILLIALSSRLDRPTATAAPPDTIRRVLVAGVVVVSLFWATSEYADALGRGRAKAIALDLKKVPAVVVFSDSRLWLTRPGVRERVVGPPRSRYRFRYDGFRFVIRSGGSYFLLPDCWTSCRGAVVVLPESVGLRFEFLPPSKGGE